MNTQAAIKERAGLVSMKGQPLTLLGDELQAGDKAPDFEVVANNLSTVKFSSFLGKACVITSVPSLDTSVCSIMTQSFNIQAEKLAPAVAILTISMDLPFAQKRWCQAEKIENLQTLSDHRDASFAIKYGVLIKKLRLLARAVFVINPKGIITYTQIVDEITNEPDYQAALNAVRQSL